MFQKAKESEKKLERLKNKNDMMIEEYKKALSDPNLSDAQREQIEKRLWKIKQVCDNEHFGKENGNGAH